MLEYPLVLFIALQSCFDCADLNALAGRAVNESSLKGSAGEPTTNDRSSKSLNLKFMSVRLIIVYPNESLAKAFHVVSVLVKLRGTRGAARLPSRPQCRAVPPKSRVRSQQLHRYDTTLHIARELQVKNQIQQSCIALPSLHSATQAFTQLLVSTWKITTLTCCELCDSSNRPRSHHLGQVQPPSTPYHLSPSRRDEPCWVVESTLFQHTCHLGIVRPDLRLSMGRWLAHRAV